MTATTTPTINRELCGQIADKIDANPEQFDMNWYGRETECGTVHCIAGWAIKLADGADLRFNGHTTSVCAYSPKYESYIPEFFAAADVLGLNASQATRLFRPEMHRPGVTVMAYTSVLRRLAHGGDFDTTINPILADQP